MPETPLSAHAGGGGHIGTRAWNSCHVSSYTPLVLRCLRRDLVKRRQRAVSCDTDELLAIQTHIWRSSPRLGTCNDAYTSVVIARLMSTAGTGFMYTTRRLRVAERLSLMKYDPVGTWFFFSQPCSRQSNDMSSSRKSKGRSSGTSTYIYQSINQSIYLYIYLEILEKVQVGMREFTLGGSRGGGRRRRRGFCE